ncbi:flagellar protein FlaG [Gammaproteobacteria bacterium]
MNTITQTSSLSTINFNKPYPPFSSSSEDTTKTAKSPTVTDEKNQIKTVTTNNEAEKDLVKTVTTNNEAEKDLVKTITNNNETERNLVKTITANSKTENSKNSQNQGTNIEGKDQEKKVADAVKGINEFLKLSRRNLEFDWSDQDERIIVTVKDADTGKIIRTIPPEEVIKLKDQLDEFMGHVNGLLFTGKA